MQWARGVIERRDSSSMPRKHKTSIILSEYHWARFGMNLLKYFLIK